MSKSARFSSSLGSSTCLPQMVHDRLAGADWATKRDIICTLVKRIEVADDVVRVIFRVDPRLLRPIRDSAELCTIVQHVVIMHAMLKSGEPFNRTVSATA